MRRLSCAAGHPLQAATQVRALALLTQPSVTVNAMLTLRCADVEFTAADAVGSSSTGLLSARLPSGGFDTGGPPGAGHPSSDRTMGALRCAAYDNRLIAEPRRARP
jgi:hypothetical protein